MGDDVGLEMTAVVMAKGIEGRGTTTVEEVGTTGATVIGGTETGNPEAPTFVRLKKVDPVGFQASAS